MNEGSIHNNQCQPSVKMYYTGDIYIISITNPSNKEYIWYSLLTRSEFSPKQVTGRKTILQLDVDSVIYVYDRP